MKKILALFVLTFFAVALFADSFPVKNGEKILFFGDSITHDGRYIAILQLMFDSRQLRGVKVMNAGISGQTTAGGLRRI